MSSSDKFKEEVFKALKDLYEPNHRPVTAVMLSTYLKERSTDLKTAETKKLRSRIKQVLLRGIKQKQCYRPSNNLYCPGEKPIKPGKEKSATKSGKSKSKGIVVKTALYERVSTVINPEVKAITVAATDATAIKPHPVKKKNDKCTEKRATPKTKEGVKPEVKPSVDLPSGKGSSSASPPPVESGESKPTQSPFSRMVTKPLLVRSEAVVMSPAPRSFERAASKLVVGPLEGEIAEVAPKVSQCKHEKESDKCEQCKNVMEIKEIFAGAKDIPSLTPNENEEKRKE